MKKSLLEQIEGYKAPVSLGGFSLEKSEPYLFTPVAPETDCLGIPLNGDFLIEELSDDDLSSPPDFA